MSDPEKNKRLLREQRESSQRRALPSALPDAPEFQLQNPLSGYMPASVMVSNDPPGKDPANAMKWASGFQAQAMGPTFLSYGPMVADGDLVLEEWESHIFGSNGTVYNNQYCWVLRFENDTVVSMREYNDTQHAAIIFGGPGEWEELEPPTEPRRRDRSGASPISEAGLETIWEVVDEFELDPKMLADVVPSSSAPPVNAPPGVEGNKAVVRALRHARAGGDLAAVGSLHAPGFRHWISGERPFGWDHLPLEEIYAPLAEHLASPITVRYGPLIGDGDIVAEEMDIFARLDDGTVFNNWACIFHDLRDGKIVQTREYHDPRHVWTVLGRWAPWGATPVEPRTRPRRSNLQAIHMSTQTPTMLMDLERWHPFD